MEKNLSALGFMSGTSGDGVDSSVVSSNGKDGIIIKFNRWLFLLIRELLDGYFQQTIKILELYILFLVLLVVF